MSNVLTFAAMETKAELVKKVAAYQKVFANEMDSTMAISTFLQETPGERLFTRNNFVGHITASAFITDPTQSSVLLLHHKKLNRWLQPGGHVDESDISLAEAACREVYEETGLASEFLSLQNLHNNHALFDIDSHFIPANTTKNEPAHIHHDFRFLFTCHAPGLLQINPAEANGFKWVPLTSLLNDNTFGFVANKLLQITEP